MKLRFGWLVLICLSVALIWLVVLPKVARNEYVRVKIQRNRDAGIDPDAMFYSDLENLTYRNGMLRTGESRQ